MTGPRRRADDHVHPDYWTEQDHDRFESRVGNEIHALRNQVEGLRVELNKATSRLSWLLGALGVAVFVVNIAVTVWIRSQ